MLVCYGSDPFGGMGALSAVERYDDVSNTWTAVAEMFEGRHAFGAITIHKPVGLAEEQDLFDMLIAKSAKYNKPPAGTA
jgi:hypothetical protein